MTTALETVVGQLEPGEQRRMVEQVVDIIRRTPLRRPTTPSGAPMRVRVTAAGKLGWIGDRSGYRYAPHDISGAPWPKLPAAWRSTASRFAPDVTPGQWDSAIVNWYDADAALGWHQDKSEADLTLPIVTISLGDSASWAVREHVDNAKASRVQIDSGAVTLLAGPTRDYEHTIERIIPAPMLRMLCGMEKPGRLSITIRVAGERA